MTLAIIAVYLGLVILVGSLSHRLFRGTGEDYFVASRSIGPFLLLMSLFGTNMTAFAILGASGEAYHEGIGVFALMASASALVIPCVFFFVGTRVWALGKRHGFLTQAQFLPPALAVGRARAAALRRPRGPAGALPADRHHGRRPDAAADHRRPGARVGRRPAGLRRGHDLRLLRRPARHRLGQRLPDPGLHHPRGRRVLRHHQPAGGAAGGDDGPGRVPSRPARARRPHQAPEAAHLHLHPPVGGHVPAHVHALAHGAQRRHLPHAPGPLPPVHRGRVGAQRRPRHRRAASTSRP